MLSVFAAVNSEGGIARNARPETWRIDELAQKAGLTVDTIRYYAREGLLPRPSGRAGTSLYGRRPPRPARPDPRAPGARFSLAAIKALLDVDRPGLEALFATRGRSYTFDDLVERSGLDAALVDRLQAVGLLADPVASATRRTTTTTSALLRAVAELREIGMTEDILVALGEIYVRHFQALQADVHAMLAGDDRDWDEAELDSGAAPAHRELRAA